MSAALQQKQLDIVARHFRADAGGSLLMPQDTIGEAIAGLIEDFSLLEDWTERYQYIIDMGKGQTMPPALMVPEHLLHGCQSQVWLVCQQVGARLAILAQSDSTIVNGLIALLRRVYDGRTAQEITATGPDFLAQLGLNDHLSPTRRNGLFAMVNAIRTIAATMEARHG